MKTLTTRLLSGVASMLVAASSHGAIISFSDPSPTVDLGSSFSLTIQGSEFPTIVSGGLNLNFDPAVLQVNSVTINQSVFEFYIGDGIEEGTIDNIAGQLTNTSFNTFYGATGSFDIMTIGFTAIGEGESALTLSESDLWVFADFYGGYIGDTVTFNTATASVTAVPLPAAIFLFPVGLGLLGLLGSRKK